MTGNPTPPMMTEAEVGAYLRVSPEQVLELVELRQLEAHLISRRTFRFTESAVEEYVERRPTKWPQEPVSGPLGPGRTEAFPHTPVGCNSLVNIANGNDDGRPAGWPSRSW